MKGHILKIINLGLCLFLGLSTYAADTTKPAADNIEPGLVALGTLGASNVYYSYLTIGAAADSFVSGSYEPKLAIAIANEVVFLNNGAVLNLASMLKKSNLSADDQQALQFLIDTYNLLSQQAKALITFITDKKDEGTLYQEYRTKAWDNIRKIFGK